MSFDCTRLLSSPACEETEGIGLRQLEAGALPFPPASGWRRGRAGGLRLSARLPFIFGPGVLLPFFHRAHVQSISAFRFRPQANAG